MKLSFYTDRRSVGVRGSALILCLSLDLAALIACGCKNPSSGDDASSDSGTTTVTYPLYLAKLTARDAAASAAFGTSVAVSGDYAIIGAYGAGGTGAAYIYVKSGSTWAQQAKLTASDAASDDYFGSSVAISGDTAVVGAYQDDDGGTDSGSAYVFTLSSERMAMMTEEVCPVRRMRLPGRGQAGRNWQN